MQVKNGNRLRELREAKGLELYDIAAHVRKSEPMISRYERGESEPPLPILRRLASFYGVTVEYLMGWDQDLEPAA